MALLTGPVMGGKSHRLLALAADLAARGWRLGGFAARSLWEGERRVGFDLVELAGGRVSPLARRDEALVAPGRVPFAFDPRGLAAGRAALAPAACQGADLVAVDEVGPLELAGGGWAPELEPLLGLAGPAWVLWVVRGRLLDQVRAHWGLAGAVVLDLASQSQADMAGVLTGGADRAG
ncbi:MAG: DUF2478 domain-containing protein [Deltaproteobacteria bacterium]|nr:DUF2478 domain-containing protein [Deltaproteobacteria bacterium]